jgi:DNA-binding NarL/FixJ family response regulator
VLVVDDQELVRMGFRLILERAGLASSARRRTGAQP